MNVDKLLISDKKWVNSLSHMYFIYDFQACQ